MKKILLFAIGILTSVTSFALEVEFEYKDITMIYQISGTNAILAQGPTTSITEVEIPDTIEYENIKYGVISIAKDAFKGNTYIEEVIIPKGVTEIKSYAFQNCSQLKKITLPSTIGTIEPNAFNGCSRLAHVRCLVDNPKNFSAVNIIQNSMMTLYVPQGSATSYKENINWKNIFKNRIYEGEMLPEEHDGMTYICASITGQATLYVGKDEEVINIPNKFGENNKYTVTGIDRGAFYGYSNIKRLTISDSIKAIGPNAFDKCTNLTHVYCKVINPDSLSPANIIQNSMMTLYVPQGSVASYKDNTNWKNKFKNRIYGGEMQRVEKNHIIYICASETKQATLYLATVTAIENGEVTVPATFDDNGTYTITGIDNRAFMGLSDLSKVVISDSVRVIGPDAFRNCNKLRTVELGDSLNAIMSKAFDGCSSLVNVFCKTKKPFEIDNNVFSNKAKATLYIFNPEFRGNLGWDFSDVQDCEEVKEFTADNGLTYVGWKKENDYSAKLTIGLSSISEISSSVSYGGHDYNVIAIGESAYNDIKSVETITIKPGIKKIETNAFKSCTGLTSITLPSDLTAIGANSFENCTGLKLITLPQALTSIGNNAFKGCSNLVEVECKMTDPFELQSTAFPDDNVILYVPNTYKSQYSNQGWTTSNFLYILQGNRTEKVSGAYTYVYGDAAGDDDAILLSSTVTEKEITIASDVPETSKKVRAIAKNAFLNNTNIEKVTIPEGVCTIGKYAFKGCRNLVEVVFPSTLTSIKDYAFDQCTSITTINCAMSNPFTLEKNVFSSIVPVIYIPAGSLSKYLTAWSIFDKTRYKSGEKGEKQADDNSNMIYVYYTGDKTATLAKISGALKNIDIPDSVTIGGEKYKVTDIGENLYKDNASNKSVAETLTMGNGITAIGANAFNGCSGLKTVQLSDSLITIGNFAFYGNSSITNLDLKKCIERIGDSAFKWCTNLVNIKLPDSLKFIGENAFESNYQLKTLEIPKKVESIGAYTFKDCKNLLNITLPDSLKSIGEYAFENSKLDSLIIPKGAKSIRMSAFSGCSNLSTLVLPSTLEEIDQLAFENCTSLKTITSRIDKDSLFEFNTNVFPEAIYQTATVFVPYKEEDGNPFDNETVVSYRGTEGWREFKNYIGGDKIKGTFDNITYEYLTGPKTATVLSAIINDGELLIKGTLKIDTLYKVTAIAPSALENNTDKKNLVKLTITEGVDSIGANAFKGCINLTSISLPHSLRTIGQSAFESNTSLPKIEIPEGVKTIGLQAFKTCSKLETVDLPSTLRNIGDYAFAACDKITMITSDIVKDSLKTISDNVFTSTVRQKATLFVPIDTVEINGTIKKYKETDGWNFENIIEGKKGTEVKKLEKVGELTYEYLTGPKTATLTKVDLLDSAYKLTIPDSVILGKDSVKYAVTAIEKTALQENKTVLKTLVISENVERIGANAFQGCSSLERVELPSTINQIGEKVFDGCKSLVYVCSKDQTPYDINSNVFPSNTTATLFVPKGYKDSYENLTTSGWNNFKKVVEGYFVDEKEVDDLTYYFLKDSDKDGAAKTALLKLSKSTSDNMVIPDSVTWNDNDYHKVTIIGESSFKDKSVIKHLTIPQYVESIGMNAFNGCDNIKTVVSKVKDPFSIKDVFSASAYNAILYVPAGSQYGATREKYTKASGWNFKHIYEGEKKDTVDNNMTFNYASSDTIAILISSNITDENLIIPDSITVNKANYKVITIDESAFKDNTSLKYLTIPEYVDSIGVNAFNGCDNIKTIVSKVKDPFDIKDAFPASANNAILYVPADSVRGISRDRYLEKTGWKNFKNIYEGEKKDTVDNNMTFNYASSDTIAILISSNNTDENLVIPDSITVNKKNYKVITIDESAFKDKSNIKYLTIPEYVDSIGVNAFAGCDSIKTIVSKIKEPFDIKENVFSASVYNVPLYVPVGTRGDYQNKNGWKKFKNIFEGDKKQYEDKATGLIYDYVTGDKTAILVKATTTDNDVLIPDSIPVDTIKYKVIAISDSVFKNNESIKKLTISENIKSIGVSAFQGCKNLERVELPSTLTEIGEKAFDGCNVITHLCTKDKTPTAINANVFSKYTATLFVPDGTIGSEDVAGTYKGENGWKKFTKMVEGYLVDVHTKDSLTYNCLMNGEGNTLTRTATLIKAEKLIDITIPDTLLIEKDSIAYKVVTIDEGAIKGNSVVNLKIGENVKTIGANAFQNCSSLKRLELPSSLTTIGENAFNNCKNLIHISSKIKSPSAITGNEFSVFTTANLYVPDGTTSLYKGTTGWKDFDNIVEGCFVDEVTSDDKTLTFICLQNGEGKDVKNNAILTKATSSNVEVPDSFVVDNVAYKVVTINNKGNAVFQSKNLQKVWLPSTLTKIGDNAFDGCKSITHVCVKTSTPPEISGNVFPENLTATLYVPDGAKASYKGDKIWNLFPAINEGYLVNVATKDKISYDCLTNGEGAKATRSAILTKSASSTTDVVIPDSVSIDDIYYKVKAISDSAFIDNVKLLNITIPENVDSIGDRAFEGCNSIATITSKIKKPFKINDNVFPTSDAALYVPVGTKADYQNTDGWKKFTNIYEGVKAEYTLSDKKMTFTYATGEKSAVLIKATTTAKNVEIPDSFEVDNMYYNVVAIENSVFKGKTTIEGLTLPSTLTKIGDNAFYGCNNIKFIISKVEKPFAIADSVFTVPTAILYVPVGTRAAYEKAGGWNFNNILEGDRKETTENGFTYVYASGDKIATLTKAKTSEKNVIIPESFVVDKDTIKVVAIGPDAFQNITSMKMIELPSTLKEIGEKAFDGCSGITSICSKIKTPFAINDNVFSESTYTAAKVYVPTGTSTDYKETGGWKKFTEMLEGELKEITTDNGITYNCVAGPNIATLVKGATTKAEVTIEGTVKDGETTYKVTEIASNAFSSNSKLEKVTINDSISIIGSGAFQNCANLKEVVIAGSVTSIGDYAFDKCSRLALVVSHIEKPFAVSDNVFPSTGAKLNIPIGSTELYQKASGWDKFSTILEGEMLETEVGGMTYLYVTGSRTATLIKGTTKEKDLTIPPTITVDGVDYSVTAIGESALANANSVESLTISEGVDSIAANAFKNCAYLNKLSLPSTLAKIGDNAFSKCDRIIHIQISVKTPVGISENVFTTTTYENATLYIPVGTTELYTNEAAIGWNKFKSVLEGDITEMTIEGMTYMCVPNLKIAKVIKGVANTKEVTIPSKIYKNGVSYQVVNVEKSAFYGFGSIEKLIISEGIKTINSTAFKNCSKLQSVVLPASMESIGENAFENCSRLTTVTCAGEKPATISDNTFPSTEISINVPNDSLVNVYKADEQWGKFSNILVTTSSISDDDDAQSNPASYQITTEEGDEENPTVAIVDDVNVSGSFAIPETVDYNGTAYTVTVIAPNTFENNTDLTDITIPSTITAIGESAFAGCSNLKSITVNIATPLDLSAPAAVRGLTRMTRSGGSSVFEGVDKETCILYVPEGSVDLYKAADVWKEFTNIQPIPATGIWEQIFTDGIPYDVYNMQGRKVRTQTTTLKGLPRGVYIVNGKKYVVK